MTNRQQPALPQRKLVICASPRSTSSSLKRLLVAAQLGQPREHFNPNYVKKHGLEQDIPKKDGKTDIAAYCDDLLQNSQVNGVFATKIFFGHLRKYLMNDIGRKLFNGADIVYLHRHDLAAQAASLIVAAETKVWGAKEKSEIDASTVSKAKTADDLQRAVNNFAWSNANWLRFFAFAGIDPLIITDQDVIHRPFETVQAICTRFGYPFDEAAIRANYQPTGKYSPEKDRKAQLLAEAAPKFSKIAFLASTYAPTSGKPVRKPGLSAKMRRLFTASGSK